MFGLSVYVSALCCTMVCVCVCVCGPRSLSASFRAYFDFPAPYSLLLTADCKTACSANAKCLGFVWNAAGCEGTPPPGNCYLKGKLEDKTAEGCSCSAIKPFPPPAPAPPGTMTSQLYGGMFHAFQSYRRMYPRKRRDLILLRNTHEYLCSSALCAALRSSLTCLSRVSSARPSFLFLF